MGYEVRIVNQSNQPLAVLENAFDVGYEKSANKLWLAWFSMPAEDEKNEFCLPLSYVELWENGQRIELFRIIPTKINKAEVTTITYECEHVLATLIDDVLFQYHEIGGTGINTTTVLNYILNKQNVVRWQLQTNQFSRQFLYKWENENLLGALFSVPNRFLEPYLWTFDTTVYPWQLSLETVSEVPVSFVYYRKNLLGIRKHIDASQLCTRMYPLGYGEGVNQLDIKGVNGGVAYIDGTTQAQYGIISRIWADRRFEDAQSLKDTAAAMLAELETPYITYEIEAADISEITNESIDKFIPGTYVQVVDEEINENIQALILTVRKQNINAEESVDIVIANKPLDVAQSIADLADRQRINEVYSQGATNLDSKDFADNCDANNPATIEFYIPEETVRINKMRLNLRTEAFRAYSKAVEGGGAYTDTVASGGGSSATSSSGGGSSTSTNSGGGTSTSTNSGGGTSTTSGSGGSTTPTSAPGSWSLSPSQFLLPDFMNDSGSHNHGITNGTELRKADGGSVWFYSSGLHNHSMYSVRHTHSVTIGSHTHSVSINDHSHSFSVPSHSHSFSISDHSHSVSIPNHTHGISIPNHTHAIQYGIFQGAPLPTSVTLSIDGNAVPGTTLNRNDVDIIPYLAKDAEGKVLRGWHTITATPNDLARIVISMASQIFVQSRGGGDF